MGLLDSVQGMMSNAASSASRNVELGKLNGRTKEINQERAKLTSQLGAALYERIREDPEIGVGLEFLCESIANLDKEREKILQQIAKLEQKSKAHSDAKQTYVCPNCKSAFSSTDVFCSGCGQKVGTLLSSLATASNNDNSEGRLCANCGAKVDAEDSFCMSCGAKLGEAGTLDVSGDSTVESFVDANTGEGEDSAAQNAPAKPSTDSEQAITAPAETQSSQCSQCGYELQPGDCFCVSCGCKVS